MRMLAAVIIGALFPASIVFGMSILHNDLELQLVAMDTICAVDSATGGSGELPLKVFFHNNTRDDIYLIVPSEVHRDRRLPLIGWSVLEGDDSQHPRELWVDTTHSGEFTFSSSSLVLAKVPGKQLFELQNGLDLPSGLSPGSYRIVFYYQSYPRNAAKPNRPYYLFRWEHQCSPMSNEVTIHITKK